MHARTWKLAAVVLVVSAPAAAAGDYRNGAYHFSLSLPEDWSEVPRAELDDMNAKAGKFAFGPAVRFEAAFRHHEHDANGYPYILVQPLASSTKGASYEDLERDLSRELNTSLKKVEGAIADVAKNVSVGSGGLDRTKNRLILRLQMDVVGVGRVHGLSVGHIGGERIVMVHAYARERDFDRWLPVFDGINSSFRFDPGYTFTPGSGGGFWNNVGAGAGRGAIIGAAAGLGVGLVVLVARVLKKRRRPDRDDLD